MDSLSTGFKRAWLRNQWNLARAAGATLLAQLNAAIAAALPDDIGSGRPISASAANGHSVQFGKPGEGTPGPESIASLAEEMLRRRDIAIAALGGSPSDAEVVTKMLASLWPARSVETRFTNLRQCAA